MVRVRMKRRIAPGHQHRKTPKKALPFHRHWIIAEKLGREWGAIGVFPYAQQGNLAAAPHHRNKEPVSVGRAGRQQDALPRHPRGLAEHERALAERLTNGGGRLH